MDMFMELVDITIRKKIYTEEERGSDCYPFFNCSTCWTLRRHPERHTERSRSAKDEMSTDLNEKPLASTSLRYSATARQGTSAAGNSPNILRCTHKVLS